MPDSPDYQKYLPGSVRFSLQDMGELAARLGSPSKYDRRGEVVFMDDFRYGLSQWTVSPGGYLNTIKLSNLNTFQSPYSVLVNATGQAGGEAVISRINHPPQVSRLGIELVFCCIDSINYIELAIDITSGSKNMFGRVILDNTNHAIKYRDSATNYATFATLYELYPSIKSYRFAKLVVDFDKLEYVRFMLDDVEYPMAGLTFQVSNGNPTTVCSYRIGYQGVGVGYNNIHFCTVIGTANEP